jgi:hypothetical protein
MIFCGAALLILGYPKESFLDANRHLTQRKPIHETVMMEKYTERKSEG